MPELPPILSSQSYAPAAEPMESPDALTRANDIFTAGMRDVSSGLASISGRMAAAQQASDAGAFEARNAMALTDMRERYRNDPDPATAAGRFRDEATSWQQQQLDGIADPNVRYYVAKNLSHRIPVAYAEVSGLALQQQHATAVATLGDTASTHAQLLANAGNGADETLAIQGLKSSIAGAVAAGTIDQPTGTRLFSASIRQAATLKGATDPLAAQSLANRYAPEMLTADVAELAVHLHPQIQRQQEDGAAAQTLQAGTSTAAGAQAVRAGFLARGYDDATATALAANAVAESGTNPAAINPEGNSRGLFQLTGPRRAAFIAQYGTEPDKAPLDQQLDFADAELKGSEAPAAATIAAAQGPNAKAQAVSRAFIRPGLTEDDKTAAATKRGAIADGLATYGGQPSLPGMIADVQQRTADLPFAVQQGAVAKVIEAYHRQEAGLAPARADLTRQISDLMAGYEAGVTDPPIPDAQIHTLLPPAEAARAMEQLTIARNAGKLFSAVQLATPAEEQSTRAALAVPGSLASQTPRRDGRVIGTTPDDPTATPQAESPEAARLRLAVAAKYEQLLTKKHEMLAADPAGYATATAPALQALAGQIDPAKPDTLQAFIDTSLRTQAQLGVDPQHQRTLTNSQVAATVQSLTSGDPTKTDIGAALDGLRQTYGDHWAGAFHDLVTVGKISPQWQVVANMTEPGQAAGRADLVRALQGMATHGGRQHLEETISSADKKTIDTNVIPDLAPFRATAMIPGEGLNVDLVSGVQEAVKTLAYTNVLHGQSAETALANATDSVLTGKYDFAGTLRTPKGQMAKAEALTSQVQSGLTAADIRPPALGDPALTADQNADIVATAARRNGTWMANPKDDGAVLLAPLRNGAMVPVIRRDGTPVSVKWADLAAAPKPTLGLPTTETTLQ